MPNAPNTTAPISSMKKNSSAKQSALSKIDTGQSEEKFWFQDMQFILLWMPQTFSYLAIDPVDCSENLKIHVIALLHGKNHGKLTSTIIGINEDSSQTNAQRQFIKITRPCERAPCERAPGTNKPCIDKYVIVERMGTLTTGGPISNIQHDKFTKWVVPVPAILMMGSSLDVLVRMILMTYLEIQGAGNNATGLAIRFKYADCDAVRNWYTCQFSSFFRLNSYHDCKQEESVFRAVMRPANHHHRNGECSYEQWKDCER